MFYKNIYIKKERQILLIGLNLNYDTIHAVWFTNSNQQKKTYSTSNIYNMYVENNLWVE